MKFKLNREILNKDCTIGELCIGDEPFLNTLEDRVREVKGEPVEKWKIAGETAIPKGEYVIEMQWSNKYGKLMPFLQDVPGFIGIMIHPGNTKEDTEGCILVGEAISDDQKSILQSRSGFNLLLSLLESLKRRNQEITIEIN